jgi:hypothetical protein
MAGIDKTISLRVIAQVKDYQKSIAGLEGDTKKAAMAAGRVLSRELIKEQVKAANEGKKAAKQSASAWKKVGGAITAALSVAAVKTAITTIASFTSEINAAQMAALRLERATGLQRDTIAGLEEAFQSAGRPAGEITDQLQDFSEKLFDASRGGGEAAEAFQILGINMDDVRNGTLSADAALKLVVDRLPRLTNEIDRAAAGQQIFSDRGLDVASTMKDIPLEQYIAQARAAGRIMTDEAAVGAAEWARQLRQLENATDASKRAIADAVVEAGLLDTAIRGMVAVTPLLSAVLTDAGIRAAALAEAFDAVTRGAPIDSSTALWKAMLPGVDSSTRLADAVDASAAALAALDEVIEPIPPVALDSAIALAEMAAALGFGAAMAGSSAVANAANAAAMKAAAAAARELAAAQKEAADLAATAAEGTKEAALTHFQQGIEQGKRNTEAIENETEQRRQALQQQLDDQREHSEDMKDALAAAGEQALAITSATFGLMSSMAAAVTAAQVQNANEALAIVADTSSQIEQIDDELAKRLGKTQKKLSVAQLRQNQVRLMSEQRAAKRRAMRAKEAARDSFDREQRLARSEVVVAGGVLAIRLAVAMAALGPAAIPAAAALTATTVGLQLATIDQQKPPSFHQGGLLDSPRAVVDAGPDSVSVNQRPGEGTLTPLGVAAAGGESGVNSLNRGGSMSQSQTTQMFLGDRLVDQFIDRGLGLRGRGFARVRREVEAGNLPGMVRVY